MSRPSTASGPPLIPFPPTRTRRERTPAPLRVVEAPAARPFAVFESKLRVPDVRAGIVSRAGLVNRLRAEREARLASIVAPAGYGKTTLLAQWAARDERAVAWLTVDERDNDPLVLLRHLATMFDRVEPVGSAVLEALAAPHPAVWADAAPRLAAAVASRRTPFVAVLDDADELRRGDAADLVAAVAEHVPEGSILALAGRVDPALPVARLRAGGRLLELGPDELALSRRDSLLLLRASGLELDEDDASELAARTEGWATGLFLATLALEHASPPARASELRGDDRYLVDYFRSEELSRLSPERLAFLRRTAVLERLSAELCDALLDRDDSAGELEAIRRAGLFLVPLDRNDGWYRYHPLFRDALRHELEQHEPKRVRVLHRRAASWFEAHGDAASALHHAQAARDAKRAARLLTTLALPGSGETHESIDRWLDRFAATAQLEEHPDVASLGAWTHALRGRAEDAERWLDTAERSARAVAVSDGSPSVEPWLALVRAALCAHGVERMTRDGANALAGLPAESRWRPTALVLEGVARALAGDRRRAEESLAAAVEAGERVGDDDARVLATAECWLLAASAGEHDAAERLALQARHLVDGDDTGGLAGSALAYAAAARAFLRHGRWDDARHELLAAERLAGSLTQALPWLAVQTRTALGAAYVTLRDRAGAMAQLAECERILARRPHLGTVTAAVDELRRGVDDLPGPRDGRSSGLTAAELRLLPLLATHLSFREIGERLYVSRNTIKTQAISTYRKLGVSSRSAAIERAVELGLVAGDAGEHVVRSG